MRLGLAGENTPGRAKALVLGSRSASNRIAGELEALGFQPVFEESLGARLPSPVDPGGFEAFRNVLRLFAVSAGDPQGYSHLLHPGASLWAERPELPALCREFGISAICPPARVTSQFTNKLSLLVEAASLGIPNLAVSLDPIHSIREIEAYMASPKARFPFVLKSIRGGSGHGIFVIHSPDELDSQLPLWLEQLRKNAGEVMLLIERYIEGAKRIVAPFARFKDGGLRVFPLVDASLQARFKKLVEFCPAPNLEADTERQIVEWTAKLADHCGYIGVGALEFFVDGNRVHLLEGVARLNTGFQLWEEVAGTQAVIWQLAALDLGALPPGTGVQEQARPEWKHGIGLRIYAEDAVLQLPQPGKVREVSERRHWRFPKAEGILQLPIRAGDELTPDGDPLVGQLFVGAVDARQANTIARGILEELWIAGSIQTGDRYLNEVLLHPWVQGGMYHASFIEEEFIPGIRPPAGLLSLFASLGSVVAGMQPEPKAESKAEAGDASAYRWAVGDQWAKPLETPFAWAQGPEIFIEAAGSGMSGQLLLEDGRTVRVCAFPLAAEKWRIRVGAWTLTVRRSPVPRRSSSTTRARVENASPRPLRALVPGRVHSILYRENALIPAHQPLLLIESLRSLVPHALPADSRILAWKVNAEERVDAGQELASFELQ